MEKHGGDSEVAVVHGARGDAELHLGRGVAPAIREFSAVIPEERGWIEIELEARSGDQGDAVIVAVAHDLCTGRVRSRDGKPCSLGEAGIGLHERANPGGLQGGHGGVVTIEAIPKRFLTMSRLDRGTHRDGAEESGDQGFVHDLWLG